MQWIRGGIPEFLISSSSTTNLLGECLQSPYKHTRKWIDRDLFSKIGWIVKGEFIFDEFKMALKTQATNEHGNVYIR